LTLDEHPEVTALTKILSSLYEHQANQMEQKKGAISNRQYGVLIKQTKFSVL